MTAVDLHQKLSTFAEHWQPRTVAQFNGHDVMVAKVKGEFVWHKHDDTDDFFLVLEGRLAIELRDRTIHLGPGELFIVPKGRRAPAGRARGGAYPADGAHRHAEHRRCGDRCAAARDLAIYRSLWNSSHRARILR